MVTYIKAEPTPALQPVEPEPPVVAGKPAEQPKEEVPPPKKSSIIIWLILLILILLGLAALGFMYLQSQVRTPPVESSPLPSVEASASPEASTDIKEFLFVQNGNVFLFDMASKSQKQLTTDGTTYALYQNPKFVRQDIYSATFCSRTADGTKAYTCELLVDRLEGEDRKIIFEYQSQPNNNNYQIGGDIYTYSWSPDQSQIAYMVNNVNDANRITGGTTQIRLINVNSKEDMLLKELPVPAGRGGTSDDERAVRFSPDGTKLMIVDTSLYPRVSPEADLGTIFVLNLTNKQEVYSQKGVWISSVIWLDDKTIFAKQVAFGSDVPLPKSSLVKIDLETQKLTTLSQNDEVNNWFQFRHWDEQKVIFWGPKGVEKQGIGLGSYSITDGTNQVLAENLLPQSKVVNNNIIVWQMKPCGVDECDMDFYNGVIADKLGLFDLETKKVTSLTITLPSSTGFDLR